MAAEVVVPEGTSMREVQGKHRTETMVSNEGREHMRGKQKTLESLIAEDRSETEGRRKADSVCSTDNGSETVYADLIEDVLSPENMGLALKKVVSNRGAPGVDGMTVDELGPWLESNFTELADKVRKGKYKPMPVRRKEIPKPDGGTRNLGIPSVVDRLLQQAVSQVLVPIYDPTFSETSYGFRPGRSPHDAVRKAKEYFEEGYRYVVDLDLAKFFDTLNQDILMNILRERIKDKALIALVKAFLRSGVVLPDGLYVETREGSPQGGPLSPLLSNIYLDRFDRLLESRGLRYTRYADDALVFVKSLRAGLRVRESVTRYLEGVLKLRVNQDKTVVDRVTAVKFLGFRLYRNAVYGIVVHPKSVKRFKERVRALTKRSRGVSVDTVIAELKSYERGWAGYFGIGLGLHRRRELDSWISRRIRQYLFKQWKTPRNRVRKLAKLCPEYLCPVPGAVPKEWMDDCRSVAYCKSYWKASWHSVMERGLDRAHLESMGMYFLEKA
ncbi:MAG: group II intron reverse transcriptase/maturase [archaeon]|nr:group II intron reverse transcriptase/maturase [archaeon]